MAPTPIIAQSLGRGYAAAGMELTDRVMPAGKPRTSHLNEAFEEEDSRRKENSQWVTTCRGCHWKASVRRRF